MVVLVLVVVAVVVVVEIVVVVLVSPVALFPAVGSLGPGVVT